MIFILFLDQTFVSGAARGYSLFERISKHFGYDGKLLEKFEKVAREATGEASKKAECLFLNFF